MSTGEGESPDGLPPDLAIALDQVARAKACLAQTVPPAVRAFWMDAIVTVGRTRKPLSRAKRTKLERLERALAKKESTSQSSVGGRNA